MATIVSRQFDLKSQEHYREYRSTTIFGENLAETLDTLGCFEDLASVEALPIGESIPLGFPQGSYDGVIITRIG